MTMTTMTAATNPQNPTARFQSSSTNDDGLCNNNNNNNNNEDNCCDNDDVQNENHQSRQRQTSATTVTTAAAAEKVLVVWRQPWMMALNFFFVFTLLFIYNGVIRRYWVLEDWNEILPGLGDSALRKLSMRSHMTFGAIAILCAPIQLITPYIDGWRWKKASTTSTSTNTSTRTTTTTTTTTTFARKWYRTVHRYTGRVYVICGILAFVFGQCFIILKHFRLVGGYNMGAAFSVSGFFIGYFAYMTWKTAPSRNNNNNNVRVYTIEDHRNYAIRSFSQIIAPILYRYWYGILVILKIYRPPNDYQNGEGVLCDDRNVCTDYMRPFDALYCWLYWISAWVVAEVVIACLPKKHNSSSITTVNVSSSTATATIAHEEEEMNVTTQTPLLLLPLTQQIDVDVDVENNNDDGVVDDNYNNTKSLVWVVNGIGCLLAGVTAIVTGLIFSAVVSASQ